MTPKQLSKHLRKEQAAGGHGLLGADYLKGDDTDREALHVKEHQEWPHLLSQDEGHEHKTEG